MSNRRTSLRRYVVRGAATTLVFAVLGVLASWRLATGQGGGWRQSPAEPTVGDTIWLEAVIAVPGGWGLRAGKLEPTEQVEPLGDPALRRAPGGGGWLVRYPVVAWSPGAHTVALPLMWRLAPDGRVDSLAGGNATVLVRSVIPDSVRHPEPQGAIAPLRSRRRAPIAPVGATLVAGLLLAAALKWRRRPPRELPPAPRVPRDPEIPDTRWLAAGEPKAVAARAAHRLRVAIARAVPEAHEALSAGECLAVVERTRPHAPLRELGDLLEQLDRVAFSAAHGTDVAALARMARRLTLEIAP